MTQFDANPYAAPRSSLTNDFAAPSYELAGLWRRLVAASIDMPLQIASFSVFFYFLTKYYPNLFERIKNFTIPLALLGAAYGVVVFFILNAKFLAENGQTIGKLICSIGIVRTDGSDVGLWHILFRRHLPLSLLRTIPNLGDILYLVNILFVFQTSRKCLHDMVADTVVVRVPKDENKH